MFADLPEQACQTRRDKGWLFYTFIGAGGAWLMCSWDITKEDVDAFISDLRECWQQ